MMLVALQIAAKATLILATAVLVTALLRHRGAATRYLVWSTALVGVLVLPLLAVVVPAHELPILPQGWVGAGTVVADAGGEAPESSSDKPAAPRPGTDAAAAPGEIQGAERDASRSARQPRASDPDRSAAKPPLSDPEHGGATPPQTGPARRGASPNKASPVGRSDGQAAAPVQGPALLEWFAMPAWPYLLAGIYLLGATLMLVHLAVGVCRVAGVAKGSRRIDDGPLHAEMDRARRQLGLRRSVGLVESAAVHVPVAWELVRPTVLLPAGASTWPRQRQRVVLLHELAHISRRDCQMQLVAQLALALHWYNPLAWLAVRRLRIEREHACDDRVLSFGTRASDYAAHLLHITRSLLPAAEPEWAAVAMARASHLETRVAAILDPRNPRRLPDRRKTMIATTTTLALLLPLAAIQVAAAPQSAAHGAAQHATAPHGVPSAHAPAGGGPDHAPHDGATSHAPTSPGLPPASLNTGSGHAPAAAVGGAGQETQPSLRDLVQMRIHGVTPEFIDAVRAAFGRPVSASELVQMRIHGTTPEFIAAVQSAFPDDEVSMENVVQMRIHGVTPEFIAGVQDAVDSGVTIRDLVQMRIHGVSVEFIDGVREELGDGVAVRDLVQMRIHGASVDFVRTMRELLADEDLTVRDITQMRIHGVTADLVRELRDDGFENLTVDDLVQMKIHGFDRWLRRRGGR